MKKYVILAVLLSASIASAGTLGPFPDDEYNRPAAPLYIQNPNGTYSPLQADANGNLYVNTSKGSVTTGLYVTAAIIDGAGAGFSASVGSSGNLNVNLGTALSSTTDWVTSQSNIIGTSGGGSLSTTSLVMGTSGGGSVTVTSSSTLMGTSGGGSLTTTVISGPPPVNGDPILNRGWCLSYFTQTGQASDTIKSSAGVLCDVESMAASTGQYMTLTNAGTALIGYFTGTSIGPLFDCGIPMTFTSGLTITPGRDGRAPGLWHLGYK